MAVVWSTLCALAALAAAVPQRAPSDAQAQYRTRVLPGNGYIRYEVQPGDDEEPPGELIVVHEERRATPAPRDVTADEPAPVVPRAKESPCAAKRAKLVARMFELQGLQIDPEFAAWLEKNRALGSPAAVWGAGESPLVLAVRNDAVARDLADDVARCEAAQR